MNRLPIIFSGTDFQILYDSEGRFTLFGYELSEMLSFNPAFSDSLAQAAGSVGTPAPLIPGSGVAILAPLGWLIARRQLLAPQNVRPANAAADPAGLASALQRAKSMLYSLRTSLLALLSKLP
jgi:hypothetical protein